MAEQVSDKDRWFQGTLQSIFIGSPHVIPDEKKGYT
jgi:hypothetical protein